MSDAGLPFCVDPCYIKKEGIAMLKKLDRILNIIMGAFTGTFIGHCIYKYWHFQNYPKLYALQSAPWHTSILLYGFFTLVLLVVCVVIKLILKRKMRK